MHDIDAKFDGAKCRVGGKPSQAMRMQMQRQRPADGLERRHQRVRAFGSEQPARVLDVNRIDTEPDQLAGFACVIIVGVDGA